MLYNEATLDVFLQSKLPMVMEALENNITSSAFESKNKVKKITKLRLVCREVSQPLRYTGSRQTSSSEFYEAKKCRMELTHQPKPEVITIMKKSSMISQTMLRINLASKNASSQGDTMPSSL